MADFLDPEESGDAAREAASLRWKGVEAFNGAAGLAPAWRRVGIALITCMDSTTRACFPGEAYLAAMCELHISAVKKAKVALREAGLISWTNPYGPRHQSQYTFDWNKLEMLAIDARARAAARVKAAQHTRQGINESVTGGKRDSHGARP